MPFPADPRAKKLIIRLFEALLYPAAHVVIETVIPHRKYNYVQQ